MEKCSNHGGFAVWHSCLCMNDVYRKKICLMEACLLSLSLPPSPEQFLHLVPWAGAPPLFCYSILPLFAQRLGAIIGPCTLHYSYLCSVHTRSSTKDIQVCEEANSSLHSCTEARRLAIANTTASPSLTLSPVWFVRCPEGFHRWQPL